jgi:hypothetical protein
MINLGRYSSKEEKFTSNDCKNIKEPIIIAHFERKVIDLIKRGDRDEEGVRWLH